MGDGGIVTRDAAHSWPFLCDAWWEELHRSVDQ